MKVVAVVCLTFTLASVAFTARAGSEPTALEARASRPDVEVVSSTLIGSIESSDAKVSISALVVRELAAPSHRTLGVRFDLANNNTADKLYLDPVQLRSLQKELTEIEGSIARNEQDDSAPYRVQGTASCWMPARPVRIVCPSYRIGPDWAGLTLGAYGGTTFAFPGRRPGDLMKLLEKAQAQIAAAAALSPTER